MLLRPTRYEFRIDEFESMNLAEGPQFGFIAQEVQEVFPHLIYSNVPVVKSDSEDKKATEKTEYIGLDYMSLIPILTAAIQEQQVQTEALMLEVESMKKKK